MKIGNVEVDKKKFGALIVAAGLTIGGIVFGITGANGNNEEAKAPTKSSYIVYYVNGEDAFVSNGEQIGYLKRDNLNIPSELEHNYTVSYQELYVNMDNVGVFFKPSFESDYRVLLNKGTKVTLNAYGDDGWAVVNYSNNGETGIGFIHTGFLQKDDPLYVPEVVNTDEVVSVEEPIQESYVSVAIITGDKVNVRSTTETGTNNRIGFCNTGDKFTIINHVDGWYLVDYYGKQGYVSEKFVDVEKVKESDLQSTISTNQIIVAKITGNNVNVRSSMNTDNDNIIGFCDITDKFEIIERIGDWYHIKYLGTDGYVSAKYVREVEIDRHDLEVSKMVYLPDGANIYDETGNSYSYLPAYQNLLVLGESGNYYKVNVDGFIGYVRKKDTASLTRRCVVVDTSRSILKVYINGKEVFRCRVITGAKGHETQLGCHTIGHHMVDYTFPDSGIFNEYWIQFDGNRGIHPADANGGKGWQKEAYFKQVVDTAYNNWASGRGKTYPYDHGSHGCVNTMIKDTAVIYDLVSVGDNVLVIEQNDLIRDNLISFNNIEQDKNLIKTKRV